MYNIPHPQTICFKTPPISGYEDIHSDEPYIEAWSSGEVVFIDMFYVPPTMRSQGVGKKLFYDWLKDIDSNAKRIKLKACTLGGFDGVMFWLSLGFIHAFTGFLHDEIENTMTMGVNGFSNPEQEHIHIINYDRHWIEDIQDKIHYKNFPQTLNDLGAINPS